MPQEIKLTQMESIVMTLNTLENVANSLECAIGNLTARMDNIETIAAARAFDTLVNTNFDGRQLHRWLNPQTKVSELPEGTYACDRSAYGKLLVINRQLGQETMTLDQRMDANELMQRILTEDFQLEEE